MRILFLGHCNYKYIGYLNGIIGKTFPEAVTGVVDLTVLEKKVEKGAMEEFDFVYVKNKEYVYRSRIKKYFKLANGLCDSLQIKHVLRLILRLSFNSLVKYFYKTLFEAKKKLWYSDVIKSFKPDICHIHYIDSNTLRYFDSCKDAKIILSFWGSDLMSYANGINEYLVQHRALNKADAITVQTIELRSVVLYKYGQNLYPKIHTQSFDPFYGIEHLLEYMINSDNVKHEVRKKYDIKKGQIAVQVGYSAAKSQNHIKIINELRKLPKELRKKIVLLLPLTYNGSDNYVNEIISYLKTSDIQFRVFTDYLSDFEMLEIKKVSEIFICLRTSDALNASMIESFYMRNYVITGAWLPYSVYLRKGLFFSMIDDFNFLAGEVEHAIRSWEKIKIKTKDNREKVLNLFDKGIIEDKWISMYKELIYERS